MAFTFAGQYGPEMLLGVATGNNLVKALPSQATNVYTVGTTTPITLYTDRTKATTQTQPVTADSNGNLTFFADPGRYDLVFTPAGGLQVRITVEVGFDTAEVIPAGVTTAGRVFTITNDGESRTSGTIGPRLDRSAFGNPIGFTLSTANVDKWDMNGMDINTDEAVLLFDYNLPGGGSGDILRFAPGAIGIYGPGIGSPAGQGWRLEMVSAGAADVATNGLMYLITRAGYTGGDHLRGHDDVVGADTWNISKAGVAAFGAPFQAFTGAANLEVKRAVTVWSNTASADPFLFMVQSNGAAAATWVVGVDYASGKWYVKNNTTGRYVIQTTSDAIDGSFVANTFGSVVGAATAQVGFFGGASMAVKQTITGSRGSNAALTSLLTALAGHGLIVNSTTA